MDENVTTESAIELPKEAGENYAFVMNICELTDIESYELAPGHVLRRATSDEISVIKSTLARLAGGYASLVDYFWEQQWPQQGGTIERAPEAQWRYFVIAFNGRALKTLNGLQGASDLAPCELEVAFTILRDRAAGPGHGMTYIPRRLFHVLEGADRNEVFFNRLSRDDLDTVAGIHQKLGAYDERLINVGRFVQQISDLKALPHESPLRFLGYFTILESLLTHTPKPTDPYESLTRQVKKKVALLDHRWANPLDYAPFGKTLPDKIWSKMYDYRSELAHGGEPSFTDKLKVLGNHARALRLIKETVKLTIRHALEEPQLLVDLRGC
jgi:hypothetical protein